MSMALMVTDSLKDYAGKQFPVSVALTISATGWPDSYMAAIYCLSCSPKGPVSRQLYKPKGHCLKVIIGREVDDFVSQGHHLPSDPVDDAVDSGAWYLKHSGNHPV
ncbi:hypothetical protein NQD34_018158 [Periophthalmus magnuspinnatus]|nr:hypothetical protein NQD34_018158 [Periophthalmus magnuspinnatus]